MNGLLIQWKHFKDAGGYTETVTLPTSFSNSDYIAVLTGYAQQGFAGGLVSKTSSNITIYHYNASYWDLIAIGY